MKVRRFYRSELTVNCDSGNKTKNYLSVLISIVVLLLISSVIVAAIVIINPEITNLSAKQSDTREAINLHEALLGELSPRDFTIQWLTDWGKQNGKPRDEFVFEESNNINLLSPDIESSESSKIPAPSVKGHKNVQNDTTARLNSFKPKLTTLVTNSSLLSSIQYQGFKVSPSQRYLLIWTNKKGQFRHSFTAKYFVYDIKLDLISLLSTQKSSQSATSHESQASNLYGSFESLDSETSYLNSYVSHSDEFTRFQLVDWYSSKDSNNNYQSDSLILIQKNDIYTLNDLGSDENNDINNSSSFSHHYLSPRRLTFTGKKDEIFNGIPDWLYEEEILGDTLAFEVSPSANTLAYMSFNDSLVSVMSYSMYGSSDQVYPSVQKIRYPKTGRVNPRVSIHVVDNISAPDAIRRDVKLSLPDDLARRQHYINRIKWLTNDKLALIWLNRNQNESHFLICSRADDWLCEKNLYLNATGGWLDISDDIMPLNEEFYLALIPKYEGPQVGYFKHLALVSLKGVNKFTFITSGNKEITSINGIDKRLSLVYFTATAEDDPGQRQLYSANIFKDSQVGSCISCDHYPDECLYNFVKMSPSTRFYVFHCEGPGIPRTELRRMEQLTSNASSGPDSHQSRLLWIMEDNRELKERLESSKVMPLSLRLKVPIAKTNYSANVLMLLPPQLEALSSRVPGQSGSNQMGTLMQVSATKQPRNVFSKYKANGIERPLHAHFTPDSIKQYVDELTSGQQYPMVVDVYAGPGSQKVDYRFNIYFGHYLATSRRTIYAMIDGRGSGYQGSRRLFELYHNFGTVEIQDQIEVAKHLAQNFSFVDQKKVAIWGWSYGGYAAAMALSQSNAKALEKLQNQFKDLRLTNSSSLDSLLKRRVTTNSLASLEGVFQCAASVAPVTNWIYYDTAYTERYMSSPYLEERYDNQTDDDHSAKPIREAQFANGDSNIDTSSHQIENKWTHLNKSSLEQLGPIIGQKSNPNTFNLLNLNERYQRASLINQIGNIDKKKFLLIHGTADDNVHFQQSIMLMKQLIRKNLLFETRLYPDQNHAIANKADKLHLGSTLSNFFAECFGMVY